MTPRNQIEALAGLCKQIVRSGEKREDAPTQEELEFWEGADAMDAHYEGITFLDEYRHERNKP